MKGRHQVRRRIAILLVTVLLAASALSLLGLHRAAAAGLSFATTSDFDGGVKDGVETSTDNPGVPGDRLELTSLKGDAFTLADTDADTFKWDVPATCTVREPSTIIRSIAGGALHIGADKATGTSRVGVVASSGVSGDIDVQVKVTEISAQEDSRFSLQVLNERRCYYSSTPKTADGTELEIDKTMSTNTYLLKAYTVLDGSETQCASGARLALTSFYLRIVRAGSTWTYLHSADGATWTQDYVCTRSVSGSLYPALFMKDSKGAPVTEYALDFFRISAGTLNAGGYRTSGSWTSAPFEVPFGQLLEHVEVSGSFDATYALDRLEILQGGSVLEAFEADNTLLATPSGDIGGAGIQLRLTLKGDGAGTPAVTRVEVAFRAAFPVTGETVVLGSSTGILNETASDDVYDVKTEALGPVSSVVHSDRETIVAGTKVSGTGPPSPSDVDSSDDVSVVYREASAPTFVDTAPDALTMASGSLDSGTFPDCAASDDGATCVVSETGTTTEADHGPAGETVALGSETGSFPSDLAASDDVSIEYREGDSGTLTQDYLPAAENVLKGIEGSGLPYTQGTFTRKTDGPGVQHVTGLGLRGRALILWWTRQSATGLRAQNSAGIALVAGPTQQFAVAWADDDAVSPSNAGRRSAAKAIAILRDGTPTLDGEASFLGFTDDGFDLDWTTNPNPAEATIVHFVELGSVVTAAYVGSFTGPAAGVLGNRAYTGVGFQGDVAIFLGSLQTALGNSVGAAMGFGAATGPLNRGSVSIAIPNGTTTADTEVVQDNRRALMMYNPALSEPTTDVLFDFTSFNPDGFTLNTVKAATGNVLFGAMVLKGGSYRANYLQRQTTLGNQAVTGLGFRPNGVLFFGGSSYLSFGAEDAGAEFVLGSGSTLGGTAQSQVTWAGSNDAVNPTNANEYTSGVLAIADLSLSSQADQNLASYKSSDADGFTVTWTKMQSTSGQKWLYLALGGEASGNPFPACAQASDDLRCAYGESSQAATGDFRAEVKYSWSGVDTTGSEWRLFVEGRQGVSNPETIAVQVYGSDEATLSSAACLLASTADAVYDCSAMTADQLDGGTPDILLSDTVRSPDGAASSFDVDQVYIRRTVVTKGLDVRLDWSGIPEGAGSYELRIEGRVGDEAVNVQVLTSLLTWTTRLTLTSTTDVDIAYVLMAGEFRAGAPSIRLVDVDPTDTSASSAWLDRVRVVAVSTTYALSVEWDWTGSVDAASATALVVRAGRMGDAEGFLTEVYDWQDGTWRPAFTVTSGAEAEYSTPLASDCTEAVGDCEISPATTGSVKIRFADVNPSDASLTSLIVDLGVVRAEAAGYVADVEYVFTTIGGRSGEDLLRVEGNRSDEDILVQVWDWDASAWATRLTIVSGTDVSLAYVLGDFEVSPVFEVRVRFVGSLDVIDPVQSSFSLDRVALEKREYRLEVVSVVAGLTGAGPFVLHLEARISGAGNFDVWVYDWSSSAWTLWLDSMLTVADQRFDRSLSLSEVSSGEVQVRFTDDVDPFDSIASAVSVDFLGVS